MPEMKQSDATPYVNLDMKVVEYFTASLWILEWMINAEWTRNKYKE